MKQFVIDDVNKLRDVKDINIELEQKAEHLDKKKFELNHMFLDYAIEIDTFLAQINKDSPKLADYLISFNPETEMFRKAISHQVEHLTKEFIVEERMRDALNALKKGRKIDSHSTVKSKLRDLVRHLEGTKPYIKKNIYLWLDRLRHALDHALSRGKFESRSNKKLLKLTLKYTIKQEKLLKKMKKITGAEIKELKRGIS